MALTLTDLVSICTTTTKTSGDTTAATAFARDINLGIRKVAGKRRWNELVTSQTIALAAADGDKTYPLDQTVDKVEEMRITTPATYARVLTFMRKVDYYKITQSKSLIGTTTPIRWYFMEPAVQANGKLLKQISFDRMPEQAYTVKYTYYRFPVDITAAQYPFFNENFHEILADYALWRYAEREADESLNPNYYRQRWADGLEELLDSDVVDQDEITPIPGPDGGDNPYSIYQ